MTLYAGVTAEGLVQQILDLVSIPTPAPYPTMVDLTGRSPMPAEGWTYDSFTDTFSPPISPSTSEKWAYVRQRRDELLRQSDFTRLNDLPPAWSAPRVEAWRTYRQALRDVPQSSQTPEGVVWPTPPA